MIITIDPGHKKGYNKGAVKGYYEGTAMYTLAELLKSELESYGVNVVLTRDENGNPTLEERGKMAIENGSKVFISLHSNYTKGEARYVCGFYSVKRKESETLCGDIVRAVAEEMECTNAWSKGALTKKNTAGTDYYGVIRHSVEGDSPVEYSFIIEHGFHSTKEQCEWLMDENNLAKLAKAEAEVIAKYFGLKRKEKKKFFRVSVGIYDNESEAEDVREWLQKSGFAGARVMEAKPEKTVEELAKEIINGKWGTGHNTRKSLLAQFGWLDFYSYEEIREKVNELCSN